MINCIAIDDEPLALALLADNISRIPFLNLVARCDDPFDAIKVLQENEIDLVFTDIQMPGITGLQFIETLVKKPMVIIVTAYKQFALQGYSLDVVDYMVKPVEMDRFLKACNKAKELFDLKKQGMSSQTSEPGYFFLNVDYSLVKIFTSDILWVEGLRDYVKIHLAGSASAVVARNSVSGIEKFLPSSKFIRIHKSYIVSINAITSVRKTSVFLGENEFPVGETYRSVIEKLIKGSKENS
ncbi:MAG: LytTR family DNA-binding domain-containing protein [Bacteroidota bacterium]